MRPSKATPSPGQALNAPEVTLGWTRQEIEIINRLAGQPGPAEPGAAEPSSTEPGSAGAVSADSQDVVPLPPPRASRAPQIFLTQRRRRLDPEQIAALTVFGLTFSGFLMAALLSTGSSGTSAPRIATRPPTEAGRAGTVSAAAQVRSEPPRPLLAPSASDTGQAVVRSFYDALGRGDGETASALVVAEKRSSRAFSPQTISRFYGGLSEPLRLTTIEPLDEGAFYVGYRYSAGRSRCDGAALVNLTSRDGRELIHSIQALNGC